MVALIRDHFASLGSKTEAVALCVAEAESNFDPLAENPSTGAAGVFQFLPSTWVDLSELAGRGGASVFDARANVAVTAWTVGEYGLGRRGLPGLTTIARQMLGSTATAAR